MLIATVFAVLNACDTYHKWQTCCFFSAHTVHIYTNSSF